MGIPIEKFPTWPAAMSQDVALAYSGVSLEQLRAWARQGAITFRARGPNGQKIVPKWQIDAALADLFAVTTADVSEDLDFG